MMCLGTIRMDFMIEFSVAGLGRNYWLHGMNHDVLIWEDYGDGILGKFGGFLWLRAGFGRAFGTRDDWLWLEMRNSRSVLWLCCTIRVLYPILLD